MKILLINNYQEGNETATYDALLQSLVGHEVQVQRYCPGLKFADQDKDLVILSGGGGEGSEIHDIYNQDTLWYEDQIKYIFSSNKPILGICMGFEVIARAYGASVVQMQDYIEGIKTITTTKKGKKLFKVDILEQHENHIWRVPKMPAEHFDVLAKSTWGIEAIKHKTRPILATQFHPEKGGTVELKTLLAHL